MYKSAWTIMMIMIMIMMIMMMMIAVSDPRVYIICVDGQPRLQSCGAHDEFDQDTLTCVRKHPFVFL